MVEWLTTEAVDNIDVTLGAMNSCSGLLHYPWAFSRMVANLPNNTKEVTATLGRLKW